MEWGSGVAVEMSAVYYGSCWDHLGDKRSVQWYGPTDVQGWVRCRTGLGTGVHLSVLLELVPVKHTLESV